MYCNEYNCLKIARTGSKYCQEHHRQKPEPIEAAPSIHFNADEAGGPGYYKAEREAVVGGQPEFGASLHDFWCDEPKTLGPCNCHLSNKDKPETPRPEMPPGLLIKSYPSSHGSYLRHVLSFGDLIITAGDKEYCEHTKDQWELKLAAYRAALKSPPSSQPSGVEDHKYLAPECSEHGCHFLFLHHGGNCAHCPKIDCPDCKGKGKIATGAQSIPWKLCSKCKATGKIPPPPSPLTQAGPGIVELLKDCRPYVSAWQRERIDKVLAAQSQKGGGK